MIDWELRKEKSDMVERMIRGIIATNHVIGRPIQLTESDINLLSQEIPIVLDAVERQYKECE